MIHKTDTYKAQRVTPQDIEKAIASEHFFTAKNGADHADATNSRCYLTSGAALERLTICVLVLRNGQTITGEASCLYPVSFTKEIAQRIAREKAIEKLWRVLGYEPGENVHSASLQIRLAAICK